MPDETKFTPGPWKLRTLPTSVGVCHQIGELGSSTKIHYACLYDDCYSTIPRDLQLLADAHLIAAAPELYANAKKLALLVANMHNLYNEKLAKWLMESKTYSEMVATLAKARGEVKP